MNDNDQRRSSRLDAYARLRTQRPRLFANPPDAAFEIVFDRARQDEVADEYGDVGVVYEDPYILLVRDAVAYRDGELGVYFRVVKAVPGAAAAVLPVLPDGRIVLVRHFRHSTRQWHWEIPRGHGRADHPGERTAARELDEELGATAGELILLGRLDTDSGLSVSGDELYLARLDGVPPPPTADAVAEGIDEIRLVTVAELDEMVVTGELTDSFTLAAYLFARTRGLLP
jgi:ADP-ribose pyrophosphatase